LTVSIPKIVELFFNNLQISPDGSKSSSSVIFVDNEVDVFFLSSGARPVLPMVVAPETIVERFSSIDSSVLVVSAPSFVYCFCRVRDQRSQWE
jgi:hypothetical protein